MTTCPNNKRGCRVIRHPDDDNYWFCPTCKRKFVEDPGFPFIILIVGMIIAIAVVFRILPIKTSFNQPNKNQESTQTRQNTPNDSFDSDQSMNQVSPTE
jgi:hypothetical protein